MSRESSRFYSVSNSISFEIARALTNLCFTSLKHPSQATSRSTHGPPHRTKPATLLQQPHLEARDRPTAEVRIYLSDWIGFEHMSMDVHDPKSHLRVSGTGGSIHAMHGTLDVHVRSGPRMWSACTCLEDWKQEGLYSGGMSCCLR